MRAHHLGKVITGAWILWLSGVGTAGDSRSEHLEAAAMETAAETVSLIVQGRSLPSVRQAVESMGGEVTHELGIINAVAVELDRETRQRLAEHPEVQRIWKDQAALVAGEVPYSEYPALVGAKALHDQGIDGYGVTVAVLDTGIWKKALRLNSHGNQRLLALYNARQDEEGAANDKNGHGTHVSSVLASSEIADDGGDDDGSFNGVAPGVDLVVVEAFDRFGQGSYADIIRGLDWIVGHQAEYGIRVLNLSFSAMPQSYYWDDPINQAVMRAWEAGIVVVTSAGNTGPAPMTIGVPANVPYVISVGAMTDNFTPDLLDDDRLSSYSAAGPTVEAFVKPDLVAPGGHMLGLMEGHHELAKLYPEDRVGDEHFEMTGTSQAAAVVSGVVALMLQQDPWLSPDDVKCRLLGSSLPAVDDDGALAYGPLQQGAGRVDAAAALLNPGLGCANLGLDIQSDLSGLEHYAGPVRWDSESASFYIEGVGYAWGGSSDGDPDGYLWTDGSPWTAGSPWTDGVPWTAGSPWTDGVPWTDGSPWTDGVPWTDGSPWTDGIPWEEMEVAWTSDLAETMAVDLWPAQE